MQLNGYTRMEYGTGDRALRFEDSTLSFQLRVLLLRQHQVHPTPAHLDTVLNGLSSGQVVECPGVFRQLENLVRRCERQLAGQRGLEVGLQELTLPSVSQHKTHVHLPLRGTAVAVAFTMPVVRVSPEPYLTRTANLPGQPLPSCGLTLTAHEANNRRNRCGKSGEVNVDNQTLQTGAEATKEIAKTGGKAIELLGTFAHYFDGYLKQRTGIAEDNEAFKRWKNRLKICEEAQRELGKRGLSGVAREIPMKFALPFMAYASLEEDEELQSMWARLLANAADSSSQVQPRTTYIDILRNLTSLDVKLLGMIAQLSASDLPRQFPPLIETWKMPDHAEIRISSSEEPEFLRPDVSFALANLVREGCISPSNGWGGLPIYTAVAITPLGTELYRACTAPKR